MNKFKESRFAIIPIFLAVFLLFNLAIRSILTFKEWEGLENIWLDLGQIYLWGFINDLINFSYVLIPLVFYLWLTPEKIYKSKGQKIVTFIFLYVFALLFALQSMSEWFFWDEFSARFNFIAVDYLVYSKEVLGNIKESYPMNKLYSAVAFSALIIFAFFFKLLSSHKQGLKSEERFVGRTQYAFAFFLLPLFSFFVIENVVKNPSRNQLVNELSYNGLYRLFHAFRHNELDYDSFYKTLDQTQVLSLMKNEWGISSQDIFPLERNIQNSSTEKNYNVMYVVMESMAASFMAEFGNTQKITPNLDRIAQESLFFSNIYATGNRTIRGMEALTLSLPPTPGYSIVKRPNNENLFSIGKVFFDKGYENKFIYGGYGYFDNMNYFFANNHFQVVDRTNFEKNEYVMANIWGVDDESLFNKAIKEADLSYKSRKKFFSFVMTTSNHRPFTYPDGRIDIPSHTSREGAVKYTDYALGKFIEDAKKKPWFAQTIFVIVADHGVGGRGASNIPMHLYHIPFMVYAPGLVKTGKINRLASQIDVAPTVLSLLGFNYKSKFFGKNILTMNESDERAILGTYSNLGFYKNGTLVTLNPNREVLFNAYDPMNKVISTDKIPENNDLLNEAISYYQHASYVWKKQLYKAQ